MNLSYAQLEATLAAHLRVHPDRMGTFRSRLKQLQRLEFPPGVNIGRGVRMAYSATHTLQLAVAFELLGLGYTAKTATDLVTEHWPKFEAAFGRVYSMRSKTHQNPTFVYIASAQGSEAPPQVSVEDKNSVIKMMWGPPAYGPAGATIIEADRLFHQLNKVAETIGHDSCASISPEYREWAERRKSKRETFDTADLIEGSE